jgi:hypothetical protein
MFIYVKRTNIQYKERNLKGISCAERDENDAWRGEEGGEMVGALGGWHCELGCHVSRMHTRR